MATPSALLAVEGDKAKVERTERTCVVLAAFVDESSASMTTEPDR